MKTNPFRPERPGITLRALDKYPEELPSGSWTFQLKLNDERAVLEPDGTLWNRHGAPFDRTKARKFQTLLDQARRTVPGTRLDLALVGIRNPSLPPRVVVLDYPDVDCSNFLDRTVTHQPRLAIWPVLWPMEESPSSGVVRLPIYPAQAIIIQTVFAGIRKDTSGLVEGVVGRRDDTPYSQGTSFNMFRSKV